MPTLSNFQEVDELKKQQAAKQLDDLNKSEWQHYDDQFDPSYSNGYFL